MDDEELARDALTLDPTRSNIVLLVGGKGQGKSEAARALFDAWPADRTVIDPTGDARPDDPDTVALIAPFPSQLPEPDEEADPPQTRVTVWARINPKSATFEADQDAAVGMAMSPRHRTKLIWRDEFSLGVTPNSMLPNDRTLLVSSRHHHASALLVCQRPVFIPKLAIAQADIIVMFKLPSPEDRERIAKNFGVTVPLLEQQYHDNQRRGPHSFLLLHRGHDAIINCPALPDITARGPKA